MDWKSKRVEAILEHALLEDQALKDITTAYTIDPKLQLAYDMKFAYMSKEKPAAYIVFGSVLMPALEQALAAGDLGSILPICAFLEDVAEAAQKDIGIETLLEVEVGEWLGGAANGATCRSSAPRKACPVFLVS
jgi:hypothetical protein